MLQEYKTKTNIGVGLGLAMQIAGRTIISSEHQLVSGAGLLLVLAGIGAFIWGCVSYAQGKGRHPAFGFLGLLNLLGLIVLVLLRDRHKTAK